MVVKQDGLERRVAVEARRISSQHQQLDVFHELVANAIDSGEPASVRTAFTRFRDALEAHFAMEDGVYFPAVHGLRPELEPELTALVIQHRALRVQLEQTQSSFDADRVAEGAAILGALVDELAEHETREEQLLAGLRSR